MEAVKLLGEDVKIGFNMACQIAFEKMTGRIFDFEELKSAEGQAALVMSVILAMNPDSGITMERILTEAKAKELTDARVAIYKAIEDWCEIPVVEQQLEEEEQTEKEDAGIARENP